MSSIEALARSAAAQAGYANVEVIEVCKDTDDAHYVDMEAVDAASLPRKIRARIKVSKNSSGHEVTSLTHPITEI